MSKSTSTPELVTSGVPSSALLSKLKHAGAHVTDTQIVDALRQVEKMRGAFHTHAIKCGVLLLARRQSLKHGQFQKLAATVWESIKGKSEAASDFKVDNFTRSLRVYTFIAQHFLADLEQNAFQPETRDTLPTAPEVTPDEVLSIETLADHRLAAVDSQIARWAGGRSLRRMMTDLRRAENAADQEESDELARRRSPASDKTSQAPAAQLDFWDDFNRPLTELETLFHNDAFIQGTTQKFWVEAAVALEKKAKEARAMAARISK